MVVLAHHLTNQEPLPWCIMPVSSRRQSIASRTASSSELQERPEPMHCAPPLKPPAMFGIGPMLMSCLIYLNVLRSRIPERAYSQVGAVLLNQRNSANQLLQVAGLNLHRLLERQSLHPGCEPASASHRHRAAIRLEPGFTSGSCITYIITC